MDFICFNQNVCHTGLELPLSCRWRVLHFRWTFKLQGTKYCHVLPVYGKVQRSSWVSASENFTSLALSDLTKGEANSFRSLYLAQLTCSIETEGSPGSFFILWLLVVLLLLGLVDPIPNNFFCSCNKNFSYGNNNLGKIQKRYYWYTFHKGIGTGENT